MNKYIIFATLLLITIFMVSCTAEVPVPEITEHQPYAARGDDSNIFVGDLSDLNLINEESTLPTSFPVYVNKYPVDQGGPIYDIDQPIVDLMTENLSRFLNILGVSGYTIEQHEAEIFYRVSYNIGETWYSAGTSDVSIITKEYGIVDDMINGTLLNNNLIQAALAYLNIENPQIAPFWEYGGDGYNYKITEATGDLMESILGNSFLHVIAVYHPDADGALIKIIKADISELASNDEVVPYEEAREYIQDKYGVAQIGAEIYYNFWVEIGYLIPCYKFFVEEGTTGAGENIYSVIEIPMVTDRGN